jgi:hypothetical protein
VTSHGRGYSSACQPTSGSAEIDALSANGSFSPRVGQIGTAEIHPELTSTTPAEPSGASGLWGAPLSTARGGALDTVPARPRGHGPDPIRGSGRREARSPRMGSSGACRAPSRNDRHGSAPLRAVRRPRRRTGTSTCGMGSIARQQPRLRPYARLGRVRKPRPGPPASAGSASGRRRCPAEAIERVGCLTPLGMVEAHLRSPALPCRGNRTGRESRARRAWSRPPSARRSSFQ